MLKSAFSLGHFEGSTPKSQSTISEVFHHVSPEGLALCDDLPAIKSGSLQTKPHGSAWEAKSKLKNGVQQLQHPKHSQTWRLSTWSGVGMLVKDSHPLKAQFPMAMTDSGIVMLSKDLQL